MSDETGWLLERNNAQYYCAGVEEQHNGMGFCFFPRETKNHLEALRFARREDAEKFAAQIAGNVRYAVVEHAWIDRDAKSSADKMLDWLQQRAQEGCVTMCFEIDGGVHVTLDPMGGEQRAAREVDTVRDGIAQLMKPNP